VAGQRQIIHVDMDAFFASVEVLDLPELAGRPVIVGGAARQRGVVSSASYEARRFGVHSAMPMGRAQRQCPDAVVRPVRMSRYVELSEQIRAIFQQYTPLVEPLSVDEAFLDVTGSFRLFGSAIDIAGQIKRRIRDELGLGASAGVAPNKFLAKLASDLEKPDGLVVVPPDEVLGFLAPLSVGLLWGVGKVGRAALERRGITRVGQIQRLTRDQMSGWLGAAGEHLWLLAQGRDRRPVTPDSRAKSISSETTFARDIGDPDVLARVLLAQCEQVARRLRRHGLLGRTVQVKARYGDFKTITRAETLAVPTDVTDVVWQTARDILRTRVNLGRGALRLLGVGVSGLASDPERQLDLLEQPQTEKLRRIDQAADQIVGRYGSQALKRAALLRRERSEPDADHKIGDLRNV